MKNRKYGMHPKGLEQDLIEWFVNDNNRIGIMTLTYDNTDMEELSITELMQ